VAAPYEFMLQPRWGDMDALGHVNNTRYLDYAQEARIAFFVERLGAVARTPLVVGRQEVDYLRPLVFRNQPVVVQVSVEALGNRSFTLLHTVREPEPDGPTYAKVSAVLVGFNPEAGGSAPLREDERAALRALLPESEMVRTG